MFFILIYGLAALIIKCIYNKASRRLGGNYLDDFLLIFILALPCALQYRVGTDYDGYVEIIRDNPIHFDLLIYKGEYAFAFLTRAVYEFGESYEQLIFIISGMIYAVMLFKILNLLSSLKYNPLILFIIIWLSTGIFHNQLSGLRNFISVYIVIYTILKIPKINFFQYMIGILFASLFHQTALFFIPFYFLKKINWNEYNAKSLFFVSFIVFSLGLPFFVLDLLVKIIVPEYARYFSGEAVASDNELNIINLVTKFVYIPIYLYALFLIRKKHFSEIGVERKMWYSLSILLAFSWALIAHGGFFFRFYHYAVFFQIFVIYESLSYALKYDRVALLPLGIILLIPYLLKVLIFESNEYSYNSIIIKWLL
jgi:hypothetical protein